jgi:RNA polymerase sigma factor (sigma-70 family)
MSRVQEKDLNIDWPEGSAERSPEAALLEALRQRDGEAGHRFVRDHYPSIHRYLQVLTGRPELAADLCQETFLQAWRYLDRFVPRAPLRAWLHRIAHRQFLQALRSQRVCASLEEVAEAAAPGGAAGIDEVELREVIRRLPVEHAPSATQIVPAELNLGVIHIPGSSNRRSLHIVQMNGMGAERTW